MKRLLLVVVIGLPGCGKSTLCSLLCTYLTPRQSCLWINYDALIPTKAFQLDRVTETSDWRKWRLAVAHCVERVIARERGKSLELVYESKEADDLWKQVSVNVVDANQDLIILLDDNFYYSSMRRIYFNLAKQYNCGFAIIECRCPTDVCLHRNVTRPNPVPELTVRQMSERFEWTDASANRWESHTCHVDCLYPFNEDTLSSIKDFFSVALEKPFNCFAEEELHRKRSSDRLINIQSILHAVDNKLRDTVRNLMLSKDPIWRKSHGKTVGDVKAQVLAEIRTMLSSAGDDPDSETCSTVDYQNEAVTLFNNRLSKIFGH